MISHQKKFIFVHINCCAGTSIEQALGRWGQRKPKDRPGILPKFSQHATIDEYLKAYPESKDYYKFAVVRNPWARMATYYATHHRYHHHDFRDWVRVLGELDNEKTLYDHARMYASCASWLSRENRIEMDAVIKFENLKPEFDTIIERLEIKTFLPHLNQSTRAHYSGFYDDQAIEIVAKRFRRDIELFEYRFEQEGEGG